MDLKSARLTPTPFALSSGLKAPYSSSTHCSSTTLDSSVRVTKAAVGGSTVTILFTIKNADVRDWEYLFVCGSHPKLGNWCPDKAIEMSKNNDFTQWTGSIQLSAGECRNLLNFRYFIGYYLQSSENAKKVLIVSKWESQQRPRCVLPSVEAKDGVCRKNHVDEFGIYGGKRIATDGWLNQLDQQIILIRLHGEALQFYKARHAQRPYYIKLTPFDVRHREAGSVDDDLDDNNSVDGSSFLPLLPSFSPTVVSDNLSDDSSFHEQPLYGKLFQNNNNYLIFKTHSLSVENLAFRIELFTNVKSKQEVLKESDTTNESPAIEHLDRNISSQLNYPNKSSQLGKLNLERFAIVYCMPASMSGTSGCALLPILTKTQQPIGQLKVDYLFANALPIQQTMEVSFARHWKKRKTIEVGHRGMGNSYTKFSTVRENTIHSMDEAAKRGADFVEFDVQLTKDKIAVIFHDFHVLVSVAKRSLHNLSPTGVTATENQQSKKRKLDEDDSSRGPSPIPSTEMQERKNSSDEYHEMAVKDLRLRQLRLLHLNHRAVIEEEHRNKLQVTPSDPHELPAHRPFPTLVEALKQADSDIGFNIEVKYPMIFVDDTNECSNYFEQNEYIDVILNDVLQYGGSRRIVFSSFEPDICSLISLKQNKYPVLFLNIGKTVRYVPYKDQRSCSSRLGLNFAMCFNLLGVNFHSEDLLADASQVARARQNGLVSFVWGEDLEKSEVIDYFRKEIFVDGIIYDRIGVDESRRNIFVVERETKHALFNGKGGVSSTPSRTSSYDNLNNALLGAAGNNSTDLLISTSAQKILKSTSPPKQRKALDHLNLLLNDDVMNLM